MLMINWLESNKDLLTPIVAIFALLLSIFNAYRNYSIGRPKITINPTPIPIRISNYSEEQDTVKCYFQFEVINKSLFPVTVKDATVLVRGQWCNSTPLHFVPACEGNVNRLSL